MHSAERARHVLDTLKQRDFISFQDLEKELNASAVTIRRDLRRLEDQGLIERVRGGVKPIHTQTETPNTAGFDATASLKRSDFNVKTYLPMIGDDVTIRISAAFTKKSS